MRLPENQPNSHDFGIEKYKFSSFSAKIQGKPFADLQKPVTVDDLPNKNVLRIPPARHISEYQ